MSVCRHGQTSQGNQLSPSLGYLVAEILPKVDTSLRILHCSTSGLLRFRINSESEPLYIWYTTFGRECPYLHVKANMDGDTRISMSPAGFEIPMFKLSKMLGRTAAVTSSTWVLQPPLTSMLWMHIRWIGIRTTSHHWLDSIRVEINRKHHLNHVLILPVESCRFCFLVPPLKLK
jgi:hypothetical protein